MSIGHRGERGQVRDGVVSDFALHPGFGDAAQNRVLNRAAVLVLDNDQRVRPGHFRVDVRVLPFLLALAHDPSLLLVVGPDCRFLALAD